MNASASPIVELREVSRVYHQGEFEIRALDGLSLAIEAGEFAALCGPSGSGKTTALNLIGALDAPDSGTITLQGRDIGGISRTERSELRRDKLGFVFQAYNLIPVLTAFENAELVLMLQGMPDKERRERVMAVLEAVGLGELANRRPDELSGGQQQRVAIARAIATRPALVLADEPTANLDTATAESLLDVMEKLNREQGVTFLFSTHDQKVMDRARRIVRLRDGKLVADERRGEEE